MKIIEQLNIKLQRALQEWSLGSLGTDVKHNITDKTTKSDIKKGDILVLSRTAITDLAKKQDEQGDVQLVVLDRKDSMLTTRAIDKKDYQFDLKDITQIEVYSIEGKNNKIFVVELPQTELNKIQ